MKNQCKLAYGFLAEELNEEKAIEKLRSIQAKYFKFHNSEDNLTEQLVEFFNHKFSEYDSQDEKNYLQGVENAVKESFANKNLGELDHLFERVKDSHLYKFLSELKNQDYENLAFKMKLEVDYLKVATDVLNQLQGDHDFKVQMKNKIEKQNLDLTKEANKIKPYFQNYFEFKARKGLPLLFQAQYLMVANLRSLEDKELSRKRFNDLLKAYLSIQDGVNKKTVNQLLIALRYERNRFLNEKSELTHFLEIANDFLQQVAKFNKEEALELMFELLTEHIHTLSEIEKIRYLKYASEQWLKHQDNLSEFLENKNNRLFAMDYLIHFKNQRKISNPDEVLAQYKNFGAINLDILNQNNLFSVIGSTLCNKDQTIDEILVDLIINFRLSKQNETFWNDDNLTAKAFGEFLIEHYKKVENSEIKEDKYFVENYLIFKTISNVFLFGNLTPKDEGDFKVSFGVPMTRFESWDEELNSCGHVDEKDAPDGMIYSMVYTLLPKVEEEDEEGNKVLNEPYLNEVYDFYLKNEIDLLAIKKTEGANFFQINKTTVESNTKGEEADPFQMTNYEFDVKTYQGDLEHQFEKSSSSQEDEEDYSNPNKRPVDAQLGNEGGIKHNPMVNPNQPEIQLPLDEPVTQYKQPISEPVEQTEEVRTLPITEAFYQEEEPTYTYETNYTVEKAGENIIKYNTQELPEEIKKFLSSPNIDKVMKDN